jgi:hypothetical protein
VSMKAVSGDPARAWCPPSPLHLPRTGNPRCIPSLVASASLVILVVLVRGLGGPVVLLVVVVKQTPLMDKRAPIAPAPRPATRPFSQRGRRRTADERSRRTSANNNKAPANNNKVRRPPQGLIANKVRELLQWNRRLRARVLTVSVCLPCCPRGGTARGRRDHPPTRGRRGSADRPRPAPRLHGPLRTTPPTAGRRSNPTNRARISRRTRTRSNADRKAPRPTRCVSVCSALGVLERAS